MRSKTIVSVLVGLFGSIASVIGFIAIFYPSLFNFETKDPEKLSTLLAKQKDIDELEKFLTKNRGMFVYLEIGVCLNTPEKSCPKIQQNERGLSVDFPSCEPSDHHVPFHIVLHEEPSSPDTFMTLDQRKQCVREGLEGDGNLVAAKYFYVPREFTRWAEGEKEWVLVPSSEREAFSR